MRLLVCLTSITALAHFAPPEAHAQEAAAPAGGDQKAVAQALAESIEDTERDYLWLDVGVTGASTPYGPAWSGGLSYQTGYRVLALRAAYNFEAPPCTELGDRCGRKLDPQYVLDAGLLYGLGVRRWFGGASAAIGLGIVAGQKRRHDGEGLPIEGTEADFVTIGVPFQAQVAITPLPFFGIGALAFGNLNAKEPLVGALVCLQIGKLR